MISKQFEESNNFIVQTYKLQIKCLFAKYYDYHIQYFHPLKLINPNILVFVLYFCD